MAKINKDSPDLQDVKNIIQIVDTHSFFQNAKTMNLSDLGFSCVSGASQYEEDDDGLKITDMDRVSKEGKMERFFLDEQDEFPECLYEENREKQEYIVIGCRLPNGVVIQVRDRSVLLRGIRDMPGRDGVRSYGGIGFTRILRSEWNEFLRNHPEWPLLQNGTIFVSGNQGGWWES